MNATRIVGILLVVAGSTTHGCLDIVKMCRSGGSRSGVSSVPTRMKLRASPAPA